MFNVFNLQSLVLSFIFVTSVGCGALPQFAGNDSDAKSQDPDMIVLDGSLSLIDEAEALSLTGSASVVSATGRPVNGCAHPDYQVPRALIVEGPFVKLQVPFECDRADLEITNVTINANGTTLTLEPGQAYQQAGSGNSYKLVGAAGSVYFIREKFLGRARADYTRAKAELLESVNIHETECLSVEGYVRYLPRPDFSGYTVELSAIFTKRDLFGNPEQVPATSMVIDTTAIPDGEYEYLFSIGGDYSPCDAIITLVLTSEQ